MLLLQEHYLTIVNILEIIVYLKLVELQVLLNLQTVTLFVTVVQPQLSAVQTTRLSLVVHLVEMALLMLEKNVNTQEEMQLVELILLIVMLTEEELKLVCLKLELLMDQLS